MPWWTAPAYATLEDPISLEPIRTLRYPPFSLVADPSLPHWTSSDYFDGPRSKRHTSASLPATSRTQFRGAT